MMNLEKKYHEQTSSAHRKALGQFFTPYPVAEFMCRWACKDAKNMLDPAAGNSVFLKYTRKLYPDCLLKGFELDSDILSFFGNPANASLVNADFLLQDWGTFYDAVVCNPPYNRFQAIPNRKEILDLIARYTGEHYSSYTNLYLLFLIKCLYQLSPDGRLAFLIPSEFLNSGYGTALKKKLIREKLVKAIINFSNDKDLFLHATTTSCILLIDHSEKDSLLFYNLSSVSALTDITFKEEDPHRISISYDSISASDKWRSFLCHEAVEKQHNLVELSAFCSIKRGIATGANDFFCFSASQVQEHQIAPVYLSECICRSADLKSPFLDQNVFDQLKAADKKVFLLDIKRDMIPDTALLTYLDKGVSSGIHRKHLPSKRNPWYSMEQRVPAPIWITTACRDGLKVIRNLSGISSLTGFHSLYLHDDLKDYTNILFCYLLTPTAQKLIRQNRKELGNGLDKYQPSDFKNAKMLDLHLLSESDIDHIEQIYQEFRYTDNKKLIEEMDRIFGAYLI